MKKPIAWLVILCALCLTGPIFASGKKENKVSVTFHMETEASDNPKMIFPQMAAGQTRYFRRSPDIITKDVAAFSPFPSEFGEDYGMVFKLKSNAANRLSALTNVNQGKWVIAQINGRVVDGFLIDKQVDDGVIVIWKGVTLADIALFDAEVPRIGAKEKKKK